MVAMRDKRKRMTIYTIGHSTRSIEDFIDLLRSQKVKQLVDIRSIPKSRHNPQFASEDLCQSLAQADIRYEYIKELGGLRPAAKHSINEGWRNASFRNYADYMQSNEFSVGLDKLITLSKTLTTTIMCAEAVPWRCHRSLVGDALVVRSITVLDIISPTSIKEHALTSFAEVEGTTLTYPSFEE